jgi:hypothetical protein
MLRGKTEAADASQQSIPALHLADDHGRTVPNGISTSSCCGDEEPPWSYNAQKS